MIESTKQFVDLDLVWTRVQFKGVVLTKVNCKAVELTKSEDVNVELSQASLLSHQSNWKVKSRAQATGRIRSFRRKKRENLTDQKFLGGKKRNLLSTMQN